jgi:segregation and condensation protein B
VSEGGTRRRRGARREAGEASEGELVSALRRRAWWWLRGWRKDVARGEIAASIDPVALVEAAPAPENDVAPPKPRRASRRKAPGVTEGAIALRRRAWSWLKRAAPGEPRAEEEPAKRRRATRRADARQQGVVELRRRSWAWFAPRAAAGERTPAAGGDVVRGHLKGVLEALIFASEQPLPAKELARVAKADLKIVRSLLAELVAEYHPRGVRLDEIAGGYVFRTSPAFAPFVREQVAKKPVKMTRAQIETLAIVAYRQPITRPEIDDVRGVDSGAVLKSLLERGLVRILGKKDEPGRPMLYGTTASFLEFFGLKAVGDLPTLREFTELSDESRRTYERELGEEPPAGFQPTATEGGLMGGEGELRAEVGAAEDEREVAAIADAAPVQDAGEETEKSAATSEAKEDVDEREGGEGEGHEADEDDEEEDEDDDDDEDEDDDDEDEDDEDDEDEEEEDDDDEEDE